MGSLDSKNVVITGGSMGIGLAVAMKCVSEGACVVIAARNKADLDSAIEQINEVSDGGNLAYSLDVSDPVQVTEFVDVCANKYKTIDGLVNCAGVYGPIGKIGDIDMVEFDRAVRINFMGTASMCNAFVPLIREGKSKKIVNFSGGGAAGPFPRYSAYASSKAAIVRLTENISLELADDGFNVNCIAPGFVVTRLHQQTIEAGAKAASDEFYEKTKEQVHNGGVPPELSADLAAFLLSSRSDGISGKFLAAPYDPWAEKSFQERLRNEKDLATLRRIDEKFFTSL